MTAPGQLALYDRARAALAKAAKVDEAKRVRDAAERLKLYARQAQDHEMLVNAAALKLRATRRLGELMHGARAAGELAKHGGRRKGIKVPVGNLDVIGVPKKLSAEAARLAKLPERTFEKVVGETQEKIIAGGARVLNPQSDVLVRERKAERRAEVVRLSENPELLPDGPFAGGVADPPWVDEDRPIGFNKRHYGYHYPLMTVDKIAAMDVGRRFGPRAAILLCCTKYHVAIGSHVIVLKAWGFEPRTEFIWHKELRGLGNGFNVDVHECLILGIRGDVPAPDPENRPLSLFSIRKSRTHSLKPDWPQQQLERWLPGGAFIYLFSGNQPERKGWCLWGHPHGEGNGK
jgi:N6-adenosine-specific RNA methylase IME4